MAGRQVTQIVRTAFAADDSASMTATGAEADSVVFDLRFSHGKVPANGSEPNVNIPSTRSAVGLSRCDEFRARLAQVGPWSKD